MKKARRVSRTVPIDPAQIGEEAPPEHANARSILTFSNPLNPLTGRPFSKLKPIKMLKEPPSRSLVRPSDLRAHAKGAPVGMASSVFGFGTVKIKEPMIEVRARLDSGQIEPVYLTEAVLVRALQKIRAVRQPYPPSKEEIYSYNQRRRRISGKDRSRGAHQGPI